MKNKLIVLVLLILFIPFTINAEVTQKERNESNNYGVNKNIEITNSNKENIMNTPYINAEEQIFDFSDILTDGEERSLKLKIDEFKSQTNMDMVIVTYNLPYSVDTENDTFASDFYDYNDFGIDLEHYSGVLLFRNTYELDRYYNIYTFGDAQLYFDYDRLELTLDRIFYEIKAENYISGFSTFIEDMKDYYKEGIKEEYKDYYIDDLGYIRKTYKVPFLAATIISAVVTLIVAIVLINKNKMVKVATKAHEYMNKEKLNITEKQNKLVDTRTTSHVISSSSSSGGGGSSFGSSSGSSGRGFSSGGGRHG